ncbi:MAG: ATP-binding cassette domain-containing protein [Candidatus Eisenbacteria sp.]|nr:ATP-binding cassette domain-containing protein [Candidatus Eisenbacteria bacterium]
MLKATGLSKIYHLGGQEVRALDGVDMEVRDGEYVRVVGASGSGKSTLLNLLAGLDTPTSGRIETPHGVLSEMSPRQLAHGLPISPAICCGSVADFSGRAYETKTRDTHS